MKNYYSQFSLIILMLISFFTFSQMQPTVGLLFNEGNATEGYTLFAPGSSESVFLINNCGYVVNEWNTLGLPEISVYLLEDGSIIKASYNLIEKRSWDDDLLWEFKLDENGIDGWNHHDIQPLANGNVLIIVAKNFSNQEAILKGRNPVNLSNTIDIDGIIEIEPTGLETGNVVWEWNAFDHLIQDFDSTKINYGVIANNYGKLDINFTLFEENGLADWLHLNAVTYNETLDQILISSRHTSEIYIIDHSTTTAEAATSSGGNSNKGGDFLWRWGNPQVYNNGNEMDRKLFGQHDPKWIPNGYPNEGKITVFNNGFQRDGEYSSVHVLEPSLDVNGNYLLNTDNIFLPETYFYTWEGNVLSTAFFGPFEGGTHILPNGNMMVCEVSGRFFEINTTTNQVVWVYHNPLVFSNTTLQQYDYADWTFLFRAEKYATNYPAFVGKNLDGINLLENENSLSVKCKADTLVTLHNENLINFSIKQNENELIINANNSIKNLKLFDLNGNLLKVKNGSNSINYSKKGLYLLRVAFTETPLIINKKVRF